MKSPVTTLGQLAVQVAGRLSGPADLPIVGAAPLSEATAGQITLIDHPDRLAELATAGIAAAVVPEGFECDACPLISVPDVHTAFSAIVMHFRPPAGKPFRGVSPLAAVSETAQLADNVDVYPGATIGEHVQIGAGSRILPGAHVMDGCQVGEDVTIGPSAVLYENTVVGDRSSLHAGVVIGAHGFGFRQVEGRHVPAAQLGNVEIGADVEVGANTTIDRGTYTATRIGAGTKIDNLVQIAHNCHIGRHNLICSQVGIAGSTSTGDYVVMGGQAGIRDHVHIGTGAVLSAMAGISNNVPEGSTMMGIPATPQREQKLKLAALAKLPEMRKEFKALRRTVSELQHRLDVAPTEHAA